MIKAKYVDALNFLKKCTLRRGWNAAKILASYQISRITKHPMHWGRPLSISIEPTTACNLRCPECPSGLRAFTRPTGNIQEDFFKGTIDQLAEELIYLIFYFQGEPYIHPKFLDMVQYADGKGLYTITSTNGHFLNDSNALRTIESGLDRLIISIDGTTQGVYEQYRKQGDLDKVIEGTRNLIQWKEKLGVSKPYLVFQFLVVKPNQHQIEDVQRLGAALGVDEVKLKTAQIYNYKKGHPLIPTIERYSRYKHMPDGSYSTKHALIDQCWKMWHSCVITWDGSIVPCCFDKDATHRLGELSESSFDAIWKGESYRQFRTSILIGRANIDICKNCTEGCMVWA